MMCCSYWFFLNTPTNTTYITVICRSLKHEDLTLQTQLFGMDANFAFLKILGLFNTRDDSRKPWMVKAIWPCKPPQVLNLAHVEMLYLFRMVISIAHSYDSLPEISFRIPMSSDLVEWCAILCNEHMPNASYPNEQLGDLRDDRGSALPTLE